MTATDEMIGIVPMVVTAGVVTRLADTMFPSIQVKNIKMRLKRNR